MKSQYGKGGPVTGLHSSFRLSWLVHPPTHPSTHSFIYPSIHVSSFRPPIHPSPFYPPMHLSIHPSSYPLIHPFTQLSLMDPSPFYPPNHPSILPSIRPSIYPPNHPPQPHVHPTAFSVSGFRLGAVRRTQGACGRICSGSPRLSVGPTVPVAPTLGFGNQERSFCCLHHRPPSCAPHPCPLLWGSPRCWREFAETS